MEGESPSLSIAEAARLMDIAPQLLRMGLQEDKLPFGFAVKGKRWAYYINKRRFYNYLDGLCCCSGNCPANRPLKRSTICRDKKF